MLFKVHVSKDTFELNPSLKAIEEFARLTDRQMKYVILSTDYKSPFRKLSPEARREQAAISAGYKIEKDTNRLDMNGRNVVDGKVGSIAAAIVQYNKMQKDDDYETLLSINELISQIRQANNLKDKSMDDLKKVVEMNIGKLDKLVETKKKLEEILDMRDEEVGDPAFLSGQEDGTINEDDLPTLSQYNETEFLK
jgi:hypothetical protein